jgi:hypothetical protein
MPPFGLTIAPATYWGVVGVMGVLVPRRWCQNDAQQNFTKQAQKTQSRKNYRRTLPLYFLLVPLVSSYLRQELRVIALDQSLDNLDRSPPGSWLRENGERPKCAYTSSFPWIPFLAFFFMLFCMGSSKAPTNIS